MKCSVATNSLNYLKTRLLSFYCCVCNADRLDTDLLAAFDQTMKKYYGYANAPINQYLYTITNGKQTHAEIKKMSSSVGYQ